MSLIEKSFDENDLIRMDEIEAARGNRPLPPDELVSYWKKTLKKWLSEYTSVNKPSAFSFDFNREKRDVERFEIRKNALIGDTESPAFFATISYKVKDGKRRWLCCPISNFTIPATMWEFAIPLKDGRLIIAESWNIFSVDDEELGKASRVPESEDETKWHIKEDSAKIIEHAFKRQMEYKFQDLPMTSVGARIFRPNDPRIEYQKNEKSRYDILSKLGMKENEKKEIKIPGVLSAKEWLKKNNQATKTEKTSKTNDK